MADRDYSGDLDRLGRELFPGLPAAERRTRVDAAFARAKEEGRLDAIDRVPDDDLFTVLLSLLRKEPGDAD